MPTRRRTTATRKTATTRKTAAKRRSLATFTNKRLLLLSAVAMALGAGVGGFMKFRPEPRRSLGEGVAKLKEQAATLKSSVSELAVEGYAQAKQAARNALEAGPNVHRASPIPSAIERNALVMNSSGT